jgi:hypothetical protein
VTRYGLDGPGIESRWREIFCTRPDWTWGPQPQLQGLKMERSEQVDKINVNIMQEERQRKLLGLGYELLMFSMREKEVVSMLHYIRVLCSF